jgi:hypothetical protein
LGDIAKLVILIDVDIRVDPLGSHKKSFVSDGDSQTPFPYDLTSDDISDESSAVAKKILQWYIENPSFEFAQVRTMTLYLRRLKPGSTSEIDLSEGTRFYDSDNVDDGGWIGANLSIQPSDFGLSSDILSSTLRLPLDKFRKASAC